VLRTIVISSLLIIAAIAAETGLQTGIGFSHLAQKYVLFEEDTLSASSEGRFFSEGEIGEQFGNHNLKGNGMLSIGTETFWSRLKGKWDWTGPQNLFLISELSADVREPYSEDATPGYWKGTGYLRVKKRWTEANGSAKLSFETKDYSGQSSYSYDYTLSKIKFDFGFPFFGEDELSLGYQFAFRYAPDTTEANYQRNNFYSSWHRFSGGNYIRGDFEAERRNYNRGDLTGNHWRVYIDIAPMIALGKKFTLAPEFTAEGYRYDMATAVYPNREWYSVTGGIEWSFSPFVHSGFGPKYSLSHAGSEVETDNFQELSLELTFDWLRYRKVWLDILLEPGIRFYDTEPSEDFGYYSNFAFVEVSAIGSYWIIPRMRIDSIVSYSPEWHDVEDDDITTLYLSINLEYEFLR